MLVVVGAADDCLMTALLPLAVQCRRAKGVKKCGGIIAEDGRVERLVVQKAKLFVAVCVCAKEVVITTFVTVAKVDFLLSEVTFV